MTAADKYQDGLRKMRMALGIIDVARHASPALTAADMASALDAASHLGYEAEAIFTDSAESLEANP